MKNLKFYARKILLKFKKTKKTSKKGFALIMVLSMVALMTTIISDVIFQSQLTVRTSGAEQNKMRAEMAAITGAQFAKMLLLLDSKLEEFKSTVNIPIPLPGGLYKILDNFPIGSEGLSLVGSMDKLNLNAMLDESIVNALKSIPGYFVIKTTNESTKLNLNLGRSTETKTLFIALKRVFSGASEKKYLEEKGYNPDRLAANIINYVKDSRTDYLDSSDKCTLYRQEKFSHCPKNSPLESLEELRRIPGFHDDEIYNIFSPYFTVWPIKAEPFSIDINSVPMELLAAIASPEDGEYDDSVLDKIEDDAADSKTINIKEMRETVELLKKISKDNSKDQNEVARLFAKDEIVQNNPKPYVATVFHYEITGVSGDVERTLEMVLERRSPRSKDKKAPPIKVLYQRFY